MGPKNSLTIRLSESVVFLRGSVESTVSGRRTQNDSQPAMLRGLLTLTIVKPTKISSIELKLEGKTVTAWPEGASFSEPLYMRPSLPLIGDVILP